MKEKASFSFQQGTEKNIPLLKILDARAAIMYSSRQALHIRVVVLSPILSHQII